ncbi:MAG: hypothetical protein M1833_002360 [Piccolia ochrophora]|nr:MAG: hypothetical protein M1833_002360 [Piccolia ochrophora]
MAVHIGRMFASGGGNPDWRERQNGGYGEGLRVPPQPSWHRRPRSPGLHWHHKYTPEGKQCGRVFMVDYVKKDQTKEGMRKVAAEEISDVEGLRRIYDNPKRDREASLRVFHVQNAHWATQFLLRKFNIDNGDSLVGTDFGNWVRHKRPERRAGRPVLNGKTWNTQRDPWRGISRTALGIDYLKHYSARSPVDPEGDTDDVSAKPNLANKAGGNVKLMDLNCYDEDDNPTHGFDVYVQKLGVYVQHKDISPSLPTDPDIENPYERSGYFNKRKGPKKRGYVPQLNTLDNGNAIIIFENSHSGSIEDTLIPARQTWESRWRRLPFYLAYESQDVSNDDHMALECMKLIMQDVFKSVVEAWDSLLDVCYTHVSILEDKIYEQPADESRAPELWSNSAMWLRVEKLMTTHVDVVQEMQNHLSELNDVEEAVENNWLGASSDDFRRLANLVQEDMVKPTDNLNDLVYKSVGIRDSRHSLQLNASMWRLSWVTFVFLPLTFTVGFFGMNVDTFENNPSMKWYFVAAIPLMLLVLVLYYALRSLLRASQRPANKRSIYESLFASLATSNPSLFTRTGPRPSIRPTGPLNRLKWSLILLWSAASQSPSSLQRTSPSSTTAAPDVGTPNATDDALSSWTRIKRHFIRTWTAQIARSPSAVDADPELGIAADMGITDEEAIDAYNAAANGNLTGATELLAMTPRRSDAEPQEQEQEQRQSRRRSPPPRLRPVSGESVASGLLVEEKEPGWLRGWTGAIGPGSTPPLPASFTAAKPRSEDDGGGGGDASAAPWKREPDLESAERARSRSGSGSGSGSGDARRGLEALRRSLEMKRGSSVARMGRGSEAEEEGKAEPEGSSGLGNGHGNDDDNGGDGDTDTII